MKIKTNMKHEIVGWIQLPFIHSTSYFSQYATRNAIPRSKQIAGPDKTGIKCHANANKSPPYYNSHPCHATADCRAVGKYIKLVTSNHLHPPLTVVPCGTRDHVLFTRKLGVS